jgi:septum formation protein
MVDLILASASEARRRMLAAAGVQVMLSPCRLDEDAQRQSLAADGTTPRDMADVLAELKARKAADRHPDAVVLGSDQILEVDGIALAKAENRLAARSQLVSLRGKTHILWSAVVIYHRQQPIWRTMGEARLTMRQVSDDFLDAYLDRNWPAVAGSVGSYHIEGEGARLFSAVAGDHFTILGLPLIPVLGYLSDRGFIAT